MQCSPTQAGPFGDNMLMGHDDFLCAEIGQVGTQFDGPAHIGMRMTMADGTTKDVYYNGFTEQDDLKGFYGVESLGIENVKAYITRGVLVDVAGYKGVDTRDHSYEVTMDDVRGALARQGISEASINDGDALFFNYGWSKLWKDPDTYNTNPAGYRHGSGRVGSLSRMLRWSVPTRGPTEVWPSPTGLVVPVHQELITKAGIFNLENMVFESVIADGCVRIPLHLHAHPFQGAVPGRRRARWQSVNHPQETLSNRGCLRSKREGKRRIRPGLPLPFASDKRKAGERFARAPALLLCLTGQNLRPFGDIAVSGVVTQGRELAGSVVVPLDLCKLVFAQSPIICTQVEVVQACRIEAEDLLFGRAVGPAQRSESVLLLHVLGDFHPPHCLNLPLR